MPDLLRLHPADNTAVTLTDLEPGETMNLHGENFACPTGAPRGHKVALRDIAEGEELIKYNQIIGFASDAISKGEHVHVHNTEPKEFERDYAFGADCRPTPALPESERRFFKGYRRTDGKVGTRNMIAVISTVNCSATVVRKIADHFRDSDLHAVDSVDGVFPITHDQGCLKTPILSKCLIGLGCEGTTARCCEGAGLYLLVTDRRFDQLIQLWKPGVIKTCNSFDPRF